MIFNIRIYRGWDRKIFGRAEGSWCDSYDSFTNKTEAVCLVRLAVPQSCAVFVGVCAWRRGILKLQMAALR